MYIYRRTRTHMYIIYIYICSYIYLDAHTHTRIYILYIYIYVLYTCMNICRQKCLIVLYQSITDRKGVHLRKEKKEIRE